MSEKTIECKAEVTRYYCPLCIDECVWMGTAKAADFDEKIKTIYYEHKCKCDEKVHNLEKIYPIVRLKEEVAVIQLLN